MDPEETLSRLCAFLGVDFEPQMLRYDVPDVLVPGIGDFTAKIRAGAVLPPRTRTVETPAQVAPHRRRWGYHDDIP
jgi:hypothetical protein